MDNYIDSFYEQEWNELTKPVIKDYDNDGIGEQHQNESFAKEKRRKASSPVLTLQLILCLGILTVLFSLKTFAFDVYNTFRYWYDSEVNANLYFSGDFSDLDYSELFGASSDEI